MADDPDGGRRRLAAALLGGRANGVPMPEIAKKLIIKTGKSHRSPRCVA
jgi:hypothetical protein